MEKHVKHYLYNGLGPWFARKNKTMEVMLLLSGAFTSRMSSAIRYQHHQLSAIAPDSSSLIGLWVAVDNDIGICHKGIVGCCEAPLLPQDVQWPWLVQKRFRSAQYREVESWLPDSEVIH